MILEVPSSAVGWWNINIAGCRSLFWFHFGSVLFLCLLVQTVKGGFVETSKNERGYTLGGVFVYGDVSQRKGAMAPWKICTSFGGGAFVVRVVYVFFVDAQAYPTHGLICYGSVTFWVERRGRTLLDLIGYSALVRDGKPPARCGKGIIFFLRLHAFIARAWPLSSIDVAVGKPFQTVTAKRDKMAKCFFVLEVSCAKNQEDDQRTHKTKATSARVLLFLLQRERAGGKRAAAILAF